MQEKRLGGGHMRQITVTPQCDPHIAQPCHYVGRAEIKRVFLPYRNHGCLEHLEDQIAVMRSRCGPEIPDRVHRRAGCVTIR